MMRNILSIDGGGIKGVFPASFLTSIEERLQSRVAEYFDLIVGTSTGGIIALGLGLGMSAKEMLTFYEDHGPNIFRGNRVYRVLRQLGYPKYDHKPLRDALRTIFGDHRLGESKTRLVIPSFNLNTGEVYVYKTAHHSRFSTDYKETLANIALATSAAPTYFPVYKTSSGIPLIDGGLWANNPAGVAAVEAVGVLGWLKDDVRILSLGCTSTPLNVTGQGGRLAWAPRIADVFLTSQSSASLGSAQLLLGENLLTRINPRVPVGKFGLDTVREIDTLKGMGATEARKEYVHLGEFFTQKVESFEPLYPLTQ